MAVPFAPGVRKHPESTVGHWEGVLRAYENGKLRVVWSCGHLHSARDFNGSRKGKAALVCAEEEYERRVAGEQERPARYELYRGIWRERT